MSGTDTNTIVICGSMDFFSEMEDLAVTLRSLGFTVYLPTNEEVKKDCQQISDAELAIMKASFIDEHLEKIKRSQSVLLANYKKEGIAGYIGANTLMEAAFAYALGKQIYVLNDLGNQSCRLEMLGIKPMFINGNLEAITGCHSFSIGAEKL